MLFDIQLSNSIEFSRWVRYISMKMSKSDSRKTFLWDHAHFLNQFYLYMQEAASQVRISHSKVVIYNFDEPV